MWCLKCLVFIFIETLLSIWGNKLQDNVEQYDIAKYEIAKYDIVKYDIVKYDIAKYDIAKYDIAKYEIAKLQQDSVVQYDNVTMTLHLQTAALRSRCQRSAAVTSNNYTTTRI